MKGATRRQCFSCLNLQHFNPRSHEGSDLYNP